MSKRIVILDTGYDSFAYEQKLFTEAGYQFEIFPGARHDPKGKIFFSKDAVGLLIRWTEINENFLKFTPRLKAITRYGVGFDNIDIKAATRFKVKVSNVQDYANHSVSDHAIAMIYSCARALPAGQQILKNSYGLPPIKNILEFHDKIIGIIGLGRIGGTLCRKVRPLFKKVLAADPYIPDERFSSLGAVKTGLENLLNQSDVISIHCNLTEETMDLRIMFRSNDKQECRRECRAIR